MLPEPPTTPECATWPRSPFPCRTVGGDFYDYVDLARERLGFALGDVAGKGPPAALLAATVQSNFVAQAPMVAIPATRSRRINNALLRRAIEARFATMFHGVLMRDGQLHSCNAGQEPPLVLRADGEVARNRRAGDRAPRSRRYDFGTRAAVPRRHGDRLQRRCDRGTQRDERGVRQRRVLDGAAGRFADRSRRRSSSGW